MGRDSARLCEIVRDCTRSEIAQDCTILHEIARDCARMHESARECTMLRETARDRTRLHEIERGCARKCVSGRDYVRLREIVRECARMCFIARVCERSIEIPTARLTHAKRALRDRHTQMGAKPSTQVTEPCKRHSFLTTCHAA